MASEAQDQVLGTPKFLQAILAFLPLREIASARLVSRHFATTIDRSALLFLRVAVAQAMPKCEGWLTSSSTGARIAQLDVETNPLFPGHEHPSGLIDDIWYIANTREQYRAEPHRPPPFEYEIRFTKPQQAVFRVDLRGGFSPYLWQNGAPSTAAGPQMADMYLTNPATPNNIVQLEYNVPVQKSGQQGVAKVTAKLKIRAATIRQMLRIAELMFHADRWSNAARGLQRPVDWDKKKDRREWTENGASLLGPNTDAAMVARLVMGQPQYVAQVEKWE